VYTERRQALESDSLQSLIVEYRVDYGRYLEVLWISRLITHRVFSSICWIIEYHVAILLSVYQYGFPCNKLTWSSVITCTCQYWSRCSKGKLGLDKLITKLQQ
jgi:hypothetical protein